MTAPARLMDHLPAIAARIDRASGIVLGLDFDGTLTPIRPRPLLCRAHRRRPDPPP
jgi:hypothetical protein